VQIAELAMEAAKNVKIIAGYFAQSTAAVAAATVQNAANASVAVTGAVAATAGASVGIGPTGFVTGAAMLALMASLLAMAGIAFGGGGGGSSHAPAKPASTVLGAEAGTASESISKSFELLEDTYDMEYTKLSGIYNEMKDLNKNIMGLVTNIIRTGGTGVVGSGIGKTVNQTVADIQNVHLKWLYGKDNPLSKLDFVGGWINKAVGWVLKSAFGGSSKTTQLAGGLGLGAISAGDILGGGGVSGYQYADMYKKTEGGWFGKDKKKYWTEYAGMDESTSDLFTQVYKGISKTLVELSKGLGTDLNAAMNYVFGAVKINLLGKSAEDISKTLQAHFSAIGDNAVEALFGSMLRGYQQVGEGLLETAVRIMIDKEVILETLKMTNQAFVGSTQSIIAFSETLIEMAGDLEALTEAASTYYNKFFTDEEKQLRLQGQLTTVMGQMNLAFPETREGYRALIEAFDLTVDWQQQAYVDLLKMSEAADKYYETLEERQQKLTDIQIDAQQKLIDAQQDVVNTFLDYVNKLKSARESMRLDGAVEIATSLSARAVLEQVRAGNYSGIASLDVSSASSTTGFETREDYQRNFFKTLSALSELERLTSNQLSIEDLTLNALQSQLDILQTQLAVLKNIDLNTRISAAAEAEKSVSAANVIVEAEAIADRAAAQAAAAAAAAAQAAATEAARIAAILAAEAAAKAVDYPIWLGLQGHSIFEHALGNAFFGGNVIPFANGGIYNTPTLFPMANGMGLMGEDGYEAVMPLSRGRDGKLGVRSDGNNVILIAEVRALRAEIKAGNYQLAKNTSKMARVMDNIDQEMNTDGILTRTA
ncbi:MAG: hypothetical protein V2A54_05965, partial [Bacteroidota bacterium]